MSRQSARSATARLLGCLLLSCAILVGCTTEPSGSASVKAGASRSAPPADAAGSGVAAQSQPAESETRLSGSAPGLFATIPDIVERAEPSVVAIFVDLGQGTGAEGSGVIWSADGVIVTNNHVVEGAQGIKVGFPDGKRVTASVIATDPRTDLAVIRVPRTGLPAATFDEELPLVGALALAIGSPIGFEDTVTQGIVSGLHRNIPGSASESHALVDLIQTDAAISPGNSGGALVGSDAHVIGINVAYIPPNPPSGRGAVSIGFAIPAPTVTGVVEQLLANGRVAHPYLGVQLGRLTPRLAQVYGYGDRQGVVILDVVRGGPAAEAGIRPGDLVIAVDDEQTPSVEDFLGALRGRQPGDSVELRLVRAGDEQTVTVTLAELPSQ
jgi:S1-C subfamily serine protease